MHVLALSALLDPRTPARTLATIAAATDRTAHDTAAHLLAHPATPQHVVDAIATDRSSPLGQALHSPAATPATRRRLLRATDPATVFTYVHTAPPDYTQTLAVADLADRARTTMSVRVAKLVFQMPGVQDDTRARALHAMLDDDPQHIAGLLGQMTLAACTLPAHLTQLAAHARAAASTPPSAGFDDPCALSTLADVLTELASEHRPAAAYVQAARARALEPAQLLRSCPDEQLAEDLESCTRDVGRLYPTILASPALRDTPVWRRAKFHRDSGVLAPVENLPTDPALALALHTPEDHRPLLSSTAQHLDADATTLTALADLCMRVMARTPGHPSITRALLRMATHPRLPQAAREQVRTSLRSADNPLLSVRAVDPLLTSTSLRRAVAHTPLPELLTVADNDYTLTNMHNLAQHMAPTLRPLWADPSAARTAFALTSTFPSTLADLVTTATAVAR